MKNLKIKKSDNKAEITLNPLLYPLPSLEKTASVFEKFLDIEITKAGRDHMVILRLKNKEDDIEKLTYEFMNYTFSEVKKEGVGNV